METRFSLLELEFTDEQEEKAEMKHGNGIELETLVWTHV